VQKTAARLAREAAEREEARTAELRRRLDSRKERFDRSAAGEVWRRLSEIDFISQALVLAGTITMWLIPSLIVLDGIRGQSTVQRVSERMGLNAEASERLAAIFGSKAPSAAITTSSVVVVALGLLGAAGAVQRLYELVFKLPNRGMRDLPRRAAWPVASVAAISASRLLDHELRQHTGGALLAATVSFAVLAAFFWWTMHFLLGARVRWRELLPPALATAAFWVGLAVFSSFYFSHAIIENDEQYGPIGDVFVLMTWLLAVGVVLILGPVVGIAWSNARRRHRRAAADAATTLPAP
jgi:membrane protein